MKKPVLLFLIFATVFISMSLCTLNKYAHGIPTLPSKNGRPLQVYWNDQLAWIDSISYFGGIPFAPYTIDLSASLPLRKGRPNYPYWSDQLAWLDSLIACCGLPVVDTTRLPIADSGLYVTHTQLNDSLLLYLKDGGNKFSNDGHSVGNKDTFNFTIKTSDTTQITIAKDGKTTFKSSIFLTSGIMEINGTNGGANRLFVNGSGKFNGFVVIGNNLTKYDDRGNRSFCNSVQSSYNFNNIAGDTTYCELSKSKDIYSFKGMTGNSLFFKTDTFSLNKVRYWAGNELLLSDSGLYFNRPYLTVNVPEGTNAVSGIATMTLGDIVVSTTAVTANSRIILSLQNCTLCGVVYIFAKTAGTSFEIKSSSATDASNVFWWIVNNGK